LAVNTRNLQLVKAELGDALAEIKRRKEQHKSAVTQLRLTRKPTPEAPREQTARDRRQQWGDDEAWMRHEIYLTWAERVLPTEKQQFVLPDDYTFGPRFFESLQPLDEGQLEKALKCILDVLIDRAKNIPGRDLHPLRQGSGGSDPQRVREDGARGWRAAIEINAASARRLHFWVNGTQIELSQVSVHDDMQA